MEFSFKINHSRYTVCSGNCKGLPEFTCEAFKHEGHQYYRIKTGTLYLYIGANSGPHNMGSYGVEHYCGDCMNVIINKIRTELNPNLKVLL